MVKKSSDDLLAIPRFLDRSKWTKKEWDRFYAAKQEFDREQRKQADLLREQNRQIFDEAGDRSKKRLNREGSPRIVFAALEAGAYTFADIREAVDPEYSDNNIRWALRQLIKERKAHRPTRQQYAPVGIVPAKKATTWREKMAKKFTTMTDDELVAYWNENAKTAGKKPTTVKKFKDTETGVARCTELAEALKGDSDSETKGRGRKSEFVGKTLRATNETAKANPRKEGTHGHKSMEIIRKAGARGIGYDDFIAAGGRSNDLRWDLGHSNVTVS